MLFDAHMTHDMLPICTKLEPSNSSGVLEKLTENVFLVNNQDDLLPTIIDEPDLIANGLQVEVAVEHASVFCENTREERMIETLDEAARNAAPLAIRKQLRKLQEH